MLILRDNNAPRGLVRALANHSVIEARARGWATLKNGDLLTAAESAGLDVLLTADKNFRYQQSLNDRKIAIVALSFGTREELTTPARQKLTTNRPRVRCLSDEHGLVALGLAARLKKSAPKFIQRLTRLRRG